MAPLHAFKVATGAWWFLVQVLGAGSTIEGTVRTIGPFPSAQFCQAAIDNMDIYDLAKTYHVTCEALRPCYHVIQPCTEIDDWNGK